MDDPPAAAVRTHPGTDHEGRVSAVVRCAGTTLTVGRTRPLVDAVAAGEVDPDAHVPLDYDDVTRPKYHLAAAMTRLLDERGATVFRNGAEVPSGDARPVETARTFPEGDGLSERSDGSVPPSPPGREGTIADPTVQWTPLDGAADVGPLRVFGLDVNCGSAVAVRVGDGDAPADLAVVGRTRRAEREGERSRAAAGLERLCGVEGPDALVAAREAVATADLETFVGERTGAVVGAPGALSVPHAPEGEADRHRSGAAVVRDACADGVGVADGAATFALGPDRGVEHALADPTAFDREHGGRWAALRADIEDGEDEDRTASRDR